MPWCSVQDQKVYSWQMIVVVHFFLVSWLELVAKVSGPAVGHVEVEDIRDVHDEDRPTEKLVRANACRSCTSRSGLQARWNKQVILL